VVSVLAVGLGVAVAVMAFAPVAPDSLPGSAVVGIHEANYDVEGGEASEFAFYFRVHTGVILDSAEFEPVADLIRGGEAKRQDLEDYILTSDRKKLIHDRRAERILDEIGTPLASTDTDTLKFAMSTEYAGVGGYYFHAFMRFKIDMKEVASFTGFLRSGNYSTIRNSLKAPRVKGAAPAAIVKQVRGAGAP
jgi:hypothetical protein